MRELNVADAMAVCLYFRDRRDWNMSRAEQALEEWAMKKIGTHAQQLVKEVEDAPPDEWVRARGL